MKFNLKLIFVVIAMLLSGSIAIAQIPVEVFVGHKKTTLDIMFFKFIKNKDDHNSKFLFFNRNRTNIDYEMTQTSKLPLFGFTEALSYNHNKLKGFAPVAVVSLLNRGVYPKMGIQFAKIKNDITLFSWIVAEALDNPNIDFFFLGRYTPKITNKLNLFTQLELVQAFPTVEQNNFSFTQRFRIGLKFDELQFGAGLDLTQLGRNEYTKTENGGFFIRYEFK